MGGRIVQLSLKPREGRSRGLPKRPVPELVVTPDGVQGDFNRWRTEKAAGDPDQAVLLLSEETLADLRAEGWPVQPGDLGENLTVAGLPADALLPGVRVHVGEVVLEVSKACDPCTILHTLPYVGLERGPAFMRAMAGRRGWFARVLQGGTIRSDTPVEVVIMATDGRRLVHDALNTAVWPVRADCLVTPVDRFFTRSHTPIPRIDPTDWRLEVDGLVDRAARAHAQGLRGAFTSGPSPQRSSAPDSGRTSSCRWGRCRRLPWGPEPVSTGEWTGVALSDLLRAVGSGRSPARHVQFTGLDDVERHGHRFGFGGSIDLAKALSGEVLLGERAGWGAAAGGARFPDPGDRARLDRRAEREVARPDHARGGAVQQLFPDQGVPRAAGA